MSLRSSATHAIAQAVFFGLGLASSTPVFADPSEPPPGGDHAHRKPPQVAYDACAELAQDDACEVELGDRTISGTCAPDREDGSLFCRPDHPPEFAPRGVRPGNAERLQR